MNQKGQFSILILVGILAVVAMTGGVYYLGMSRNSASVTQPTPQME